jgi:two-component system, LytTR family, sensor kinase
MNWLDKKELKISLLIGGIYVVFFNTHVFLLENNSVDAYLLLVSKINWGLLFTIATNICLHLFVIPQFRKKDKKIIRLILISIVWLAMVFLGLSSWFSLGKMIKVWYQKEDFFNSANIVRMIFRQLNGIAFFSAAKFLYDSYKLNLKNRDLSIERKIAELNFLRAQTNPHFLFNTLNNIYSLSRKNSNKVSSSVLRLSEILRYMLYETQIDMVPIKKEIKVMEEYVELEKLRYDNSLSVILKHTIDNGEKEVPPLLMIPLIENAFKHGASETRNNPFVHIKFELKEFIVKLEVANSVGDISTTDPVREGIGLKNIRRQLELLFSEYELTAKLREISDLNNLDGLLDCRQEYFEKKKHYFYSLLVVNLKSYAKN